MSVLDDDQSFTACCPRECIPDSCTCPDGCTCMCLDCGCVTWGEEYHDALDGGYDDEEREPV